MAVCIRTATSLAPPTTEFVRSKRRPPHGPFSEIFGRRRRRGPRASAETPGSSGALSGDPQQTPPAIPVRLSVDVAEHLQVPALHGRRICTVSAGTDGPVLGLENTGHLCCWRSSSQPQLLAPDWTSDDHDAMMMITKSVWHDLHGDFQNSRSAVFSPIPTIM